MNEKELVRRLQSVGKQAFVEHFYLFQNCALGRLSRVKVVDELVRLGVSNSAGAGMRAGNAKLIFDARKEMDALSIVLESRRLPSSVLAEARKLRQ